MVRGLEVTIRAHAPTWRGNRKGCFRSPAEGGMLTSPVGPECSTTASRAGPLKAWTGPGCSLGYFLCPAHCPPPQPNLELVVVLGCGRLLIGDHARPVPYQQVWRVLPQAAHLRFPTRPCSRRCSLALSCRRLSSLVNVPSECLGILGRGGVRGLRVRPNGPVGVAVVKWSPPTQLTWGAQGARRSPRAATAAAVAAVWAVEAPWSGSVCATAA